MAKDSRVINGSVRIEGTVFVAGQEDELEAAMSSEQSARLTEMGVISGFGKGGTKAAEKAEKAPSADEQADSTDAETSADEPADKPAGGRSRGK